MTCKECGCKVPSDSAFCINCGIRLDSDKLEAEQSFAMPASRGSRFIAAVLDGAILWVPAGTIALLYPATGIYDSLALATAVVTLALLVAQIVMLTRRGQTIGKWMMSIRIVCLDNGEIGGFTRIVLLRSFLNGLLTIIPLYGLIDVVHIFREDRRCVHDLIAKTHVIKA